MHAHRAGFSLIELVIVVTLLAVMAMTVTPVFTGSFGAARAENAARDLHAELVAARERAVTHVVEYRVYFDEKENTYWVAHGPFVAKDEYAVIENIEGEIVAVPDRLLISDVTGRRASRGARYIAFYPNGATDVGEVELTDERDRNRTYRIETTGARVEFFPPE
jgi:prepilin-type N-terminal cleavage/methylation domain-containing protein